MLDSESEEEDDEGLTRRDGRCDLGRGVIRAEERDVGGGRSGGGSGDLGLGRFKGRPAVAVATRTGGTGGVVRAETAELCALG